VTHGFVQPKRWKLGYKSFPRTTLIRVGKVIGRAYEKTQALDGDISGVSHSILTHACRYNPDFTADPDF